MSELIYRLDLKYESDVVEARQRAREIAERLGFDRNEQVRLATATSEMARNAFRYATGGRVEFHFSLQEQSYEISIRDTGKGIPHLQTVLAGRYKSDTGMGMGILGTKRLMDDFELESNHDGTRVRMGKRLPRSARNVTKSALDQITSAMNQRRPDDPFQELQVQNRELLSTLAELRSRQEELARLNRELEDTNRGVVALYAELDERADFLRRASELKTTFLSNMSHEFRTPLNSILSLTQMLLTRMDGELTSEQEKQTTYIRQSAQELYEMVNDLLDLAKVEAGKVEIRPKYFNIRDTFSALRGMLKPLLADNKSLSLVFEAPEQLPPLFTDEAKLSQILRNFVSNAIKFTRKGEVRVSAQADPGGQSITISVTDTGIGIDSRDIDLIFEEFSQIDSALQRSVKGTGLGLPLSRKFAQLLGGSVQVRSEKGVGSVFSVQVPVVYSGEHMPELQPIADPVPGKIPILLVEDNEETAFLFKTYLSNSEFQVFSAPTELEARAVIDSVHPQAALVDVVLKGDTSFALIEDIAKEGLPVVALSVHDHERSSIDRGAVRFIRKPTDRETLRKGLRTVLKREMRRALIVDDQEAARYVLRTLLEEHAFEVTEARSGMEGIKLAPDVRPELIFLDLSMPGMTGFEVIERLKNDASLRSVPRIVNTSLDLSDSERAYLRDNTIAVLNKAQLMEPAGRRDLTKAIADATQFSSRAGVA